MLTRSHRKKINQLMRRVRASDAILHYDHHSKDLAVWYWPTNERGERVTPSDLEQHRELYQFRGPGCFCSMQRRQFTEAAISLALQGRFRGAYIASCSRNRCGYFIMMERRHSKRGLPVRFYPRRGENEAAPPPVEYEGSEVAGGGRQRRAPIASDINTNILPRLSPSNQMTVLNCLFRMDSAVNPGITLAQLRRTLTTCKGCELVMTKRVFPNHECEVDGNEEVQFIDLSQDDDDDDDE